LRLREPTEVINKIDFEMVPAGVAKAVGKNRYLKEVVSMIFLLLKKMRLSELAALAKWLSTVPVDPVCLTIFFRTVTCETLTFMILE